jgi:hypothetical protein
MKDPADNKTIDMLIESHLAEITAEVRVMQAASPCVKWCDRTVGEARYRLDEKTRRSGRPHNRRGA